MASHRSVIGCSIRRPVAHLQELPVDVHKENAARWCYQAKDDQKPCSHLSSGIVQQCCLLHSDLDSKNPNDNVSLMLDRLTAWRGIEAFVSVRFQTDSCDKDLCVYNSRLMQCNSL